MTSEDKNKHAREQAETQLNSVCEMVDEYQNACDLGSQNDIDEAQARIYEDPLSVQVRSGWYSPGSEGSERSAAEFEILLCTGGPAVKIQGDLDEWGQPENPTIYFQDWFTSWEPLYIEDDAQKEKLLTYCQQFYYGEGA